MLGFPAVVRPRLWSLPIGGNRLLNLKNIPRGKTQTNEWKRADNSNEEWTRKTARV